MAAPDFGARPEHGRSDRKTTGVSNDMSSLSLRKITKSYGTKTIIPNLDLEVADGAFVALPQPLAFPCAVAVAIAAA